MNAYMARRRGDQQTALDAGHRIGMQHMLELVMLALGDSAVMGKDVIGLTRLKRIREAVAELDREVGNAWYGGDDAEQCRSRIDRRLKPIWGDEFIGFYERNPLVRE